MSSSSVSGTCSRAIALVAVLLGAGLAVPVDAKVFHSQEEALELAFPEAGRVESETYILTATQKAEIQRISRARVESEIVTLYTGWKGDELLGHAFIDVHTVRTLPEAFMVVLGPEGSVASLRVLAFYEPLDYLPTQRWYRQFDGASLSEQLRLGRDVHGIVGATLSARAVTASVRRMLAFRDVLLASPASHD